MIPEDIDRKALLVDAARWCRDDAEWAWCGGPPLSYFQDEYFEEEELFPARVLRFYDVDVRVPRLPWALLERAYGAHCRHIARVDEHVERPARDCARVRRAEFQFRDARVRADGARRGAGPLPVGQHCNYRNAQRD